MNIECPWNLGDDCFAVRGITVEQRNHCEICQHTEIKEKYVREIRPGKVCGIQLIMNEMKDEPRVHWSYVCNFDGYSTNVSKIWKTREEAEKEYEGIL